MRPQGVPAEVWRTCSARNWDAEIFSGPWESEKQSTTSRRRELNAWRVCRSFDPRCTEV